MYTAQWPPHQGGINGVVVKKPLLESSSELAAGLVGEKRAVRAQKEQPSNCPRCNSSNTKFCYYNNYNLSQPRHFCKTCRRYWTQGGSLRNVPVGGGSRKNRSRPSSSSNKQIIIDPPPQSNNNLMMIHGAAGSFDQSQNPSLTTSSYQLSLGSSIPPIISTDSTINNINTMFSSPNLFFPLQEMKPTTTLNYFGLDPHGFDFTECGNGERAKLFDQIGRGDNEGNPNHHSIGFLNNGMFGGESWQL